MTHHRQRPKKPDGKPGRNAGKRPPKFQPEICEHCDKYCYNTYQLAVHAVLRSFRKGFAASLRIYQCPHRRKARWHLTKNR